MTPFDDLISSSAKNLANIIPVDHLGSMSDLSAAVNQANNPFTMGTGGQSVLSANSSPFLQFISSINPPNMQLPGMMHITPIPGTAGDWFTQKANQIFGIIPKPPTPDNTSPTPTANSLPGYNVPSTTSTPVPSANLAPAPVPAPNPVPAITTTAPSVPATSSADKVIQIATAQIGKPYLFGGTLPNTGFDCSGLVQWAYAQDGVHLPRTAQQQYDSTSRIGMKDLRPGDLVFFAGTYNSGSIVSHVGIYIGNGQMINAPTEGQNVQILPVFTGYWGSHFYGGGRVTANGW